MPCNPYTLRYWMDMHNLDVVGSQYVMDHDGAIRIFYIHENRGIDLVREIGAWEKDYAAHFTLALESRSTIFICPGCEDVVH